jgi:hypothetical protein
MGLSMVRTIPVRMQATIQNNTQATEHTVLSMLVDRYSTKDTFYRERMLETM